MRVYVKYKHGKRTHEHWVEMCPRCYDEEKHAGEEPFKGLPPRAMLMERDPIERKKVYICEECGNTWSRPMPKDSFMPFDRSGKTTILGSA